MLSIAIIGGSGPQGKGLGYRFAKAGHAVMLGSRSHARGTEAASELANRLSGTARLSGTDNATATAVAGIVVLALPYEGQQELVATLRPQLAGKIVISCVNPLGFDKAGPYGLIVPEGSAAEQSASLLPESVIVGAFHHLSAVKLLGDAEWLVDEDVLVCGNDATAKQTVIELAVSITGKPGIDAGQLRMARQLEPFTAVLISINKRYQAHSGVAISGLVGVGHSV
jgi:NADPH-dependent F420 reductase